jgi:hypothetical protein
MTSMQDLHVVEPGSSAATDDWAGVRVPAGHAVKTGYVPIHEVVVYSRPGHQLSPAAVERAYCRQLELGDDQAWPPPTGYQRNDGRFVLTDGRTRFVAALMLGMEYVFVAWLVPPQETCPRCAGTGFDGEGETCLSCLGASPSSASPLPSEPPGGRAP